MELQEISKLIDLAVESLAFLFPLLGVYAVIQKRTKEELLKVLDQCPVNNRSLWNMAKNLGQEKAAKEINLLEL